MIDAKKSLKEVSPYVPGRPISEIQRLYGLSKVTKLASNENPLGASPKVREAVCKAAESVFLYPDGGAYDLRMALSRFHGLDSGCFAFGTGSDGLIELIAKTFLTEGDESLMPDPSFSLYETNVLAAGGTPIKIPLKNHQVSPSDFLAHITEKTKVIWLCNPNNPTGGIYTEAQQSAFLEKVPDSVLVVLDEAYYEYAVSAENYPNSQVLLSRKENIIILRTFSKVYGLAGLRVGYAMAHPRIISLLEKARAPFNVSTPAQLAAQAALEDQDFVRLSLSENEKNKEILMQGFDRLGLSYIDSYTNFLAVDTGRDSLTVTNRLLAAGYIVKGGHVLGLPDFLRVTVGTKEECEGFLTALETILEAL